MVDFFHLRFTIANWLSFLDPVALASHPLGMSFFITGTDTGVGKTYVTRLVIASLRAEGRDAVGYKPIACGDRQDAVILAAVSGGLDLDEINPVHLNTAVAPYVAGLLENRKVVVAELLAGFHHQIGRAHV